MKEGEKNAANWIFPALLDSSVWARDINVTGLETQLGMYKVERLVSAEAQHKWKHHYKHISQRCPDLWIHPNTQSCEGTKIKCWAHRKSCFTRDVCGITYSYQISGACRVFKWGIKAGLAGLQATFRPCALKSLLFHFHSEARWRLGMAQSVRCEESRARSPRTYFPQLMKSPFGHKVMRWSSV